MRKWIYLGVGLALGLSVSLSGKTTSQDPVQLSPEYYTVRFENDRVRVLEYRLPPGRKEPMHSHPPGVVYALSDATMRSSDASGHASETSRKAGELAWRDATTHATENLGMADVRALAVELKPCSK